MSEISTTPPTTAPLLLGNPTKARCESFGGTFNEETNACTPPEEVQAYNCEFDSEGQRTDMYWDENIQSCEPIPTGGPGREVDIHF